MLRASNPQGLAEHAQWLTEEGLKAILGHRLSRAAVTVGELGTESTADLVHDIVHLGGDYVARVDHAGRFQRLLDRRSLVERVARLLSTDPAKG